MFVKDSAASAADEAKKRQDEEERKKVEDAKKKRAAGGKSDPKTEETALGDDKEVEEGQTELEQAQEAEDQDTTDFVNSVKEMTGLWDIDPPDSMWLAMDRLNHETGVRDPMGQLCFRFSIVSIVTNYYN